MSLKIQEHENPWHRVTSRLPESENWRQEEGLALPEVDQQKALIVQMQQQVQLSNLLNQINNEIRSTLDIEEILTSACIAGASATVQPREHFSQTIKYRKNFSHAGRVQRGGLSDPTGHESTDY